MTQEVSLGDALVLTTLALAENRIPHRAIYDMGYIVKNPFDMVIACDALIALKEVVDEYYERHLEEDATAPPHEFSYFEAGDGDPEWLEEDDERPDPADL